MMVVPLVEVTPELMKVLVSGRRDVDGSAWLRFRLAGFDEGGTFSISGSRSTSVKAPIWAVPSLEMES
jgi:hypothetical protein